MACPRPCMDMPAIALPHLRTPPPRYGLHDWRGSQFLAGPQEAAQAGPELWIGNQARMLVLLGRAAGALEPLAVPALPRAARQQLEADRSQTEAAALAGVFD